MTLGSVTTSSDGGAAFKGNVPLQPGSYYLGLLVFASGQPASPVGVSVPRGIHVTLPGATQTSTYTTNATESRAATYTSTTSELPQAADELGFTPIAVPNAPTAYPYGDGSGDTRFMKAASTSLGVQRAEAVHPVSAPPLGQWERQDDRGVRHERKGRGSVGCRLHGCGEGRFVLGLTVVDQSTFASPRPSSRRSPRASP